MSPDMGPLRYAMVSEPGPTAGQLAGIKNTRQLPIGSMLVLPCEETFRNLDSSGTKTYRKLISPNTRFKGCQAVEEELIDAGLVRVWAAETLTLPSLLEEIIPDESEFTVPDSRGAMGLSARTEAYGTELKQEEQKWASHKTAGRTSSTFNMPLSELLRPGPLNARQSQARRLLEQGHFDEDPKLKAAAYLISKNITEPDLIRYVMPTFDYNDFKKYEGKVHAEIQATLSDRMRNFLLFLESLTGAQREAIQKTYLENPAGNSREEIAKQIGISPDSLADRLSGAKRKLVLAYPEFRPKGRSSSTRRRRPAGSTVRVTQINPRTGERRQITIERSANGRMKNRVGANPAQIRQWVRNRCPIVFPST